MHDVLTNVADVTQDHAGMRAILRTIAYIGLPRHGAPPCLSGEQSESVSLKTPCGSGRLPRWDAIPATQDHSPIPDRTISRVGYLRQMNEHCVLGFHPIHGRPLFAKQSC